MWQNSITHSVKNLKFVTKLKKNQIPQNFSQNVTKLELWQISIYEKKPNFKQSFRKNILTPWQPMSCSLGSALQFLQCFISGGSQSPYVGHFIWLSSWANPGVLITKGQHSTKPWHVPSIFSHLQLFLAVST